jgi:hypothetical protein
MENSVERNYYSENLYLSGERTTETSERQAD